MIYTASYFESNRHHGRLISISRSVPKGFKVDGRLDFFVPSAELLSRWKAQEINEEQYTELYRAQIKQNFKAIKAWLSSLDPQKDMTLLCWEKSGIDETLKQWQETGVWKEEKPFCHRNLAIKMVQRFRQDCYGGTDVLSMKLPLCPQCLNEVAPSFLSAGYDDAHYCSHCRSWTKKALYPDQPERQAEDLARLTPV
jgi:uncharacterized protein YeaO (DUF488 family)